jgi:hypothetical protein
MTLEEAVEIRKDMLRIEEMARCDLRVAEGKLGVAKRKWANASNAYHAAVTLENYARERRNGTE